MKRFIEDIQFVEYYTGRKLSTLDKFNLILRIIFNL